MPLTVVCPICEDGVRWIPMRGGLDPDVRVETCDYCGGSGEHTLCCDSCDDDAEEWFQGHKFCAGCYVEQKTDALYVGEDAT